MVQKQIASSFDYKRKEMLNKPITTLKKERIQAIRITPDTIRKHLWCCFFFPIFHKEAKHIPPLHINVW